ncbi:hypothetical protein [Polaromonas sp.]|uniref:hypothetical protein n=1 Tax=Polaromonas sp. TaxID=1869339 RepID=UPI00352A45A0
MPQLSLHDYDDEQLAELARQWRQRAAYGNREAYGIAHALERELRARTRVSQFQAIEPARPPASPPPWWAFWRSGRAEGESDPSA